MTTSPLVDNAESSKPSARLVYRDGDEVIAFKSLMRHSTLIGSAQRCHMQLQSESVSKMHCVITLDDNKLHVRDLRSRTGIRVNGKRVEVSPLHHGDTLAVGEFWFEVDSNLMPTHEPSVLLNDSWYLAKADDSPRQRSAIDGALSIGSEESSDFERQEIAEELLQRGLITEFQARWLSDRSLEGARIGPYELADVLGVGGMGWVFSARHWQTRERAAVKMIPNTSSREMKGRLKVEAQIGQRLDNPHLVKTLSMGDDDDSHFLVTEFIDGLTLHELVNLRGSLPWQQACDITRQVALGLDEAHRHGIVHRDVKPSNVLITADGHARLFDYGLARIVEGDDEALTSGVTGVTGAECVGTPDFMAPEQADNSNAVSYSADIYSLGCTMYFALTGMVPFPVASPEGKLEAHRTAKARPKADCVADVPKRVLGIVGTMMAKSPEHRFRDMQQTVRALEAHAEKSPVDFDFRAVLNWRAAEARFRMKNLLERARKEDADQHAERKAERTSISLLPSETADEENDADLEKLIQRWPKLNEEQRAVVLQACREVS